MKHSEKQTAEGRMETSRTYKDGVFTALFNEPAAAAELYNAIKGRDICSPEDITIRTLTNAIYKPQKDDVAFSVGNKFVIMLEHQSTPSENMPIRMFIYLARVLEKCLDDSIVHGSKLVHLPSPELYVLYNGSAPWQGDEFILKLSDAFEGSAEAEEFQSFLELEVKVININNGKNRLMLERSQKLGGYSYLIEAVRQRLQQGLTRDEAVTGAIRECVAKDILVEFLHDHGSEVLNMLFEEFDMEKALEIAKREALEEGLERGLACGLERGLERGRLEAAASFKARGLEDSVIAEALGLSLEEVQQLNVD